VCLWDILEYVVVIDNSLYGGQHHFLIPVYEVLLGNTGLAIRIRELTGEKGREEGPDKRIGKANDTPEAVVGDIVERLGYHCAVLFTRARDLHAQMDIIN
jgi:hypothetical protein